MSINRINNTGQNRNVQVDQTSVSLDIRNDISNLNSMIIAARVTDIVLNENHPYFKNVGEYNGIGAVFYEIINQTGTNTDTNNSTNFALPYDPQLKTYPLINEYVILIKIPNNQTGNLSSSTSYFYLNPVNIWNHPHHDAYPNPITQALNSSEDTNDYTTSTEFSGSVRRVGDDNEYFPDSELNSKKNESQFTFVEKANIHPLMPFMGDVLLEGRHGQSIRFGSTARPPETATPTTINNNWSVTGSNGDPITILRNGQPSNSTDEGWIPITEDLSKDLSSFYLTSYQKIPFSITNENFISYTTPPITPAQYTNPQIILNSDRIVINAKNDSVLISGQNSIGLSSNGSINLESTSEINITSKLTHLGNKDANQSVLRGDETVAYLKILITELQNIAEALKVVQDWPGGAPTPNPVILTVANSALQVFENVYNEIDSVKSKIVKTA
jgi:hypothetical protein